MKTLLLFIALVSAPFASAHTAPKIHMLFLIDSNAGQVGDDIGPACRNNASALKRLFEKGLREDQLRIRTVTGDDMNPEKIKWELTGFRQEAMPDEAVFVYFCGHGVVREGNEHVFGLAGGEIKRQEIVDEMRKVPSRLQILITDTCTSFDRPQSAPAQDYTELTVDQRMYEDLFLRARGFVDFTAASFGEFAWSSGGEGGRGVFSQSLERMLMRDRLFMDSNMDSVVSWAEMFSAVRRETSEAFLRLRDGAPDGDKIKESQAQTPSVWSLGFDSDLLSTTYRRHYWAFPSGSYEMQSPGVWVQRDAQGKYEVTLEKTGQDKDFIYFKHPGMMVKLAVGNAQAFTQAFEGDSEWHQFVTGNWIQPWGRNRAEWVRAEGGRFRLEEGEWQEFDANGDIFARFVHSSTQNGNVTIYDRTRDVYVKLTPDGASWRRGEEGEFTFLYPGSWAN